MIRRVIMVLLVAGAFVGCRSSKEAEMRDEGESATVEAGISRRELCKDELTLRLRDAYIELDSVEIEGIGAGGERLRAERARIVCRERSEVASREGAWMEDSVWRGSVSRHEAMVKERRDGDGGLRRGWRIVVVALMLIGFFFLTLRRR